MATERQIAASWRNSQMSTGRKSTPSAACADISSAGEEEIRLSGEGVNHENDKTEANFDENVITQNVQGVVEVTTNSGVFLGLDKGVRTQSEADGKSGTRDLVSEFRRLQMERFRDVAVAEQSSLVESLLAQSENPAQQSLGRTKPLDPPARDQRKRFGEN